MTLKEYITAGYGAGTYRKTLVLKEAKKRKAKAKNQMVFLEKCLAHNVLPKSFKIHAPLKGQNARRIVNKCRYDLLICAKNDARRRFFCSTRKALEIKTELEAILNADDLATIIRVTDSAQEKMFRNAKSRMITKFNELTNEPIRRQPNALDNVQETTQSVGPRRQRGFDQHLATSHVKNPVLNLREDEVPAHHQELLELGPKFVPNAQRIPHMDIITATECSSLKLEYGNKVREAQTLRKDVLLILKMKKPARNNLTRNQRRAISEIRNDNETSIYPFDKGAGLVRISTDSAKQKIREQLGETTITDTDPTDSFVTKIQKKLSGLRKLGRFTDKEYDKMYPSDAIPPRMYGMIKAHKPEKRYPMRFVVSTIGTANYRLSEYLVKICQNTLSKNNTRIKNSQSFVEEAKTWTISPEEVQVSYDVVNLYPSVPIKEATNVLIDQLNEDMEDVKMYTKLKIGEIKELIDLCLSKCYFIWNEEIHEMENKGPIGLSMMVVMAESYLQFLEKRAIDDAIHQQPPISLKTHRRYVDDSHSRFREVDDATKFKDILNKQDKRIQYTMEVEKEGKILNYLDVITKNNGQGRYDFDVFRKKAITNVQVKPNSSHDPKVLQGIFKGFVHRAHKICSEQFLNKELDFLVNIFVENGYNEKMLRKSIDEVGKKIRTPDEDPTEQVDDGTALPTITLPWIPVVSPKLRKVFRKAGYKVSFKANPNLQAILTKKNKVKLPPNSQPGIYRIPCGCQKVNPYIGKTKLKTSTRIGQHEDYVRKGDWKRSGVSQHAQTCPVGPLFDEADTVKVIHGKFERSVRESLEIQKYRSSVRFGGMNVDDGGYLKTTFWVPFMDLIHKEQQEKERQRVTSNANLTSEGNA